MLQESGPDCPEKTARPATGPWRSPKPGTVNLAEDVQERDAKKPALPAASPQKPKN
jgi:hypothetical protein